MLAAVLAVGFAARASADGWLPHPAGARWQYAWSDTTYNPGGTVEDVDVAQQQGPNFTLAWAQDGTQPPGVGTTMLCPPNADLGAVSFQDTTDGLMNTTWTSCPPPSSYATGMLCAPGTSSCPDSLASFLYNVIWGLRDPVLAEPLVQGLTWTGSGGASGDVAGTSTYLGLQVISVPAFPAGVTAAVVRTNVALSGTGGDGYGSGIRTTWWVYGVGPVRFVFDHVNGSVTSGSLESTNLTPIPDPGDEDYFPVRAGLTETYRWTNRRHLPRPELDRVTVAAVAASTARFDVRSTSGPIRASGAYDFTANLDGVRSVGARTAAASVIRQPRLGHGWHFFTVLDLMTFGLNQLLPVYPTAGDAWRSDAWDRASDGARGSTRIIGVRWVHVPAGTFRALEVRSVLTQPGHPYGSGVRTMWFAPGRGLVKLVFVHRDGSVSRVDLVR